MRLHSDEISHSNIWEKTKWHMTISFFMKHLYSHSTAPVIFLWPHLDAERERTWRGMLSTRVVIFLGRTVHTWRTVCCNSGTIGGGDPCLRSRTRWVPNMLSGVHVWTLCWEVHDPHIPFPQKSSGVTCCVGRGVVLDIHKILLKTPIAQWSIPSQESVM